MQRVRLCGVGRHCLRCTRLAGVRYDRAALQQMTVRDLKHIMKIVDVSSATCRGELVRAVGPRQPPLVSHLVGYGYGTWRNSSCDIRLCGVGLRGKCGVCS